MITTKVEKLISQMTLEEKAAFCVGKDFWHLQGLERLGIEETMVTDGPHGLRKQMRGADHLGLGNSEKAVCFPAGCALASSFDPQLAEELGCELGKLAASEAVSTVLGPAMNIKRSPLCGRNFEYYSEDPLLGGKIAAGLIRGIQQQNVGACPKHFLANNQEYYRQTSNSVVDEQTLREVYLPSFEEAVKEAEPWSIMCSYNRINGTYASENKHYLTDILRNEWGFEGYIMTDWGACNDPVDSIAAGLDLEMPGPAADNVRRIKEAVERGKLEETILDKAVGRILRAILRYTENKDGNKEYDFEAGHETARKIENQSAILLKNEDNILPLQEGEKIVFIGKYVKEPRYQGGGSSHVSPWRVSSVWDAVKDMDGVSYAEGFGEREDVSLAEEAVEAAKNADKVVIFAGLPEVFESEGIDRKRLDMPSIQNSLIQKVAEVQPNTIVVLHNGSPVSMSWIADVKAVLELYLGGEAVGLAAADLLYGKENPSGRLAETFPIRIEDTPAFPYYGVERNDVVYREGRLVGYRFYETMRRKTLFPFGYGLSYTTYSYSGLRLSSISIKDNESLLVHVDVSNTGDRAGKEVVQLYVSPDSVDEVRPVRELRAFRKIELEPGERKTVSFTLGKRAFAEWNVGIHDWYVPTGDYKIQIGRSAADIVLEDTVSVTSTASVDFMFTVNTPLGDLMACPAARHILQRAMGEMRTNSLTKETDETESDGGALSKEAKNASADAMPLRALLSFVPGITREKVDLLLNEINLAVRGE